MKDFFIKYYDYNNDMNHGHDCEKPGFVFTKPDASPHCIGCGCMMSIATLNVQHLTDKELELCSQQEVK